MMYFNDDVCDDTNHMFRVPSQDSDGSMSTCIKTMTSAVTTATIVPMARRNEQQDPSSSTLTFIDLFCGIGGFHQALRNMGMSCLLACDINRDCRNVYEMNYGIKPAEDVRKLCPEKMHDFDVLCGGFPCQPFSKAGHQKGLQDKRGNLFFVVCDIIRAKRPGYVILENVRNIASHDRGRTWQTIHRTLTDLGYLTYEKPVVLNARHFGIPQNRERVIIMAKRQDLGQLPSLPRLPRLKDIRTCLDEILDTTGPFQPIEGKVAATETVWESFLQILSNHGITIPRFPIWTDWWDGDGIGTSVTKKVRGKTDAENQALIRQRQDAFYAKYRQWIDKNRAFYRENQQILEPWLRTSRATPGWSGTMRKFEWQVRDPKVTTLKQALWSTRSSGIRVKDLDYAPTLVAMASMIPIYGPGSRYLTPRECLRLQSFPETFVPATGNHITDKQTYKQAGNAVNVRMIERAARLLIKGQGFWSLP